MCFADGKVYNGPVDEAGEFHGDDCDITWPPQGFEDSCDLVAQFHGSFIHGKATSGRVCYTSKCVYEGAVNEHFQPHGERGMFTWQAHNHLKCFLGSFEHGLPVNSSYLYIIYVIYF